MLCGDTISFMENEPIYRIMHLCQFGGKTYAEGDTIRFSEMTSHEYNWGNAYGHIQEVVAEPEAVEEVAEVEPEAVLEIKSVESVEVEKPVAAKSPAKKPATKTVKRATK